MLDIGVFFICVLLLAPIIHRIWRRLAGASVSRAARTTRIIASILLALVASGLGSWKFSTARSIQLFGGIVPRVETSDSVIAITFDDGPLPGSTERVLEMLRSEDVPATFF